MIKWVVRLAIITALLGLGGTVLILLNVNAKKNNDNVIIYKKTGTPKSDIKIDSPVIKPVLPDTIAAAKPAIKKADTATKVAVAVPQQIPPSQPKAISKQDKAPGVLTENKNRVVPTKGNKLKPEKPVKKKKPDEKLFTINELKWLVAKIYKVKAGNGNYSNCVQILFTAEENHSRKIRQIETYLKSKKFSIAGKEITSQKIKGIKVTRNAPCIRLTIGSF